MIAFLIPRWFAKRFLHPDIVAEYSYIFLWDEDLGVENFNPQRYLLAKLNILSCIPSFQLLQCSNFIFLFRDISRYVSIVQREGLEISQPALDISKSEVHHQITARVRGSIVHRSVIILALLILIHDSNFVIWFL